VKKKKKKKKKKAAQSVCLSFAADRLLEMTSLGTGEDTFFCVPYNNVPPF
jgi:hypothetical protein